MSAFDVQFPGAGREVGAWPSPTYTPHAAQRGDTSRIRARRKAPRAVEAVVTRPAWPVMTRDRPLAQGHPAGRVHLRGGTPARSVNAGRRSSRKCSHLQHAAAAGSAPEPTVDLS